MPDGERKTRIAAVGITQGSKSGLMVIRVIFGVTDKAILPREELWGQALDIWI